MSRKFLIITLLILFIGALPRSIEVLSGNYLFGYDQGIFYNAAKSIVVDHKPTLIGMEVGGAGGFFQGPGWYYLLTIPFIFTKGDPYGGMILMLIIGLSTIFFAIYLGSKMFGKKTGLLIGFLIAISPAIIPQSRFIWPPFPISFFSVFFLFFLYKVLSKNQKYLPLITFTIGIMSHFEIATAGTLFIQLILFSPLLIVKKLISLRTAMLSVFSFLVTLAPLILFDLRHDFLNTRGILKFISGSQSTEIKGIWKYISSAQLNLDVFKYNFMVTFNFNELLWPFLLFIIIVGSAFYIRDRKIVSQRRLLIFYLLTSPLLFFIAFLIYRGIWAWWLLELHVFYSFLLGILIVHFGRKLILKPFLVLLILLFFISYAKQTVNFYRYDFHDFGGTAKMKGKLEVIDYIYQDAKGKPFGLLIFSPPIYTFGYDYLIWWRSENKYHYIPYQEKKGTFYLLIEPDPHKPWRHIGWLETVMKEGKTVYEKKFESDFIVQKRIAE